MNFSAASGVFAIWSSSFHAAKLEYPSSLRLLRPQLRNPRDGLAVSLASPFSARFHEFSNNCWRVPRFAQRDEIGLLRRVLQRESLSLDLAPLRGFGSGGNLRITQSRQRGLIGRDIGAASLVAASSLLLNSVDSVAISSFSFFNCRLVSF